MRQFLLSILLFLLYCCQQLRWSLAHPQCLDFLPPFTNPAPLAYCSDYSAFTCCSSGDDAAVESRMRSLTAHVAQSAAPDPVRCTQLVKEISCARCSPYASHVYDAETTGTATAIAGLCPDFCAQAVAACGMTFMQQLALKDNQTFASTSQFCNTLQPIDPDYCVPYERNFTARLAQTRGTATGGLGCLCTKQVMSGLRNPVVMAHAGDGSHRLFVGEQLGVVRVLLPNGTVPEEPFIDLQSIVVTSQKEGDERGLLGMAFHPNYTSNGYVFFHLNVGRNGAGQTGLYNRVLRFTVSQDNPNKVNSSTAKTILEVRQLFGNHNGGEILFGNEDGYLYVFLGDGGAAGDPGNNAQNRNSLLGSALRLDVNTPDNVPYAIPPSNPFVGTSYDEEIFAYGLRNPWGCSQDIGDRERNFTDKGRIFCGDVGQNRIEEVDIIQSGKNYGWRAWEGTLCFNAQQCAAETNTVFPIFEYDHTVGKSVTGGYVYRGCLSPNLQGLYIFGDFVNGRMFSLREDPVLKQWNSSEVCFGDATVCNNGLEADFSARFLLSFGQGESGEVFVMTTDFPSTTHTGGRVSWLVDPARRGAPSQCSAYFSSSGNVSNIPAHFINGGTVPVDFQPGSSSASMTPGISSQRMIAAVLACIVVFTLQQ